MQAYVSGAGMRRWGNFGRALFVLCALLLTACSSTHVRTDAEFDVARDLGGKSVVLVEPSIQLFEMQASGLMEPRADWTRAARDKLPAAINVILAERQANLKPEYRVPAELPADAKPRQVLALNEAVTVGMIAGLMMVIDADAVSVSPTEFSAENVHVVVPTPPIAAVAAVV